MVKPRKRRDGGEEGVALLMALGVLLLVYMLGTVYVSYMALETQDVMLDAEQLHVQTLAERGMYAAISELGGQVQSGQVEDRIVFDAMPMYHWNRQGDGHLEADDSYKTHVEVAVADESGKVNLNTAPVRVLQTVLHVDGGTARSIRSSLPRPGAAATAKERWFTNADELVTRGFMAEKAFKAIPKDLFRVYPVPGTADTNAFLNLNAAPAEVLAALFEISVAKAREVAAQRPFTSFEEVQQAVGRDPATYNVAWPPAGGGGTPSEVTLDSRCFRLRCTAQLEKSNLGPGRKPLLDTIEAVVFYDAKGHGQILSWRALPPEEADAA